MTMALAITNLLLGTVYTGYGVITLVELGRESRTKGFSHFGWAWVAMAFTCGPHHLEHGFHLLVVGRTGGALDLAAVIIGIPFGVVWFLLRLEALFGGRGDRFISGTPRWVAALPVLGVIYHLGFALAVGFIVRNGAHFGPRMTPNLLLLGFYGLVGYYMLRTQLANRGPLGGWSVSGLSLTAVFPTCGLMHASFSAYAAAGHYDVDVHGLTIDWLAVPAALYFVWVVRMLAIGAMSEWNDGSTGVNRETLAVT